MTTTPTLDTKDIWKQFGKLVANRRRQLRLSQKYCSDQSQMDRQTWYRIVDLLRRGEPIADVLYAVENRDISVARGLEILRSFLLTGKIEDYGQVEALKVEHVERHSDLIGELPPMQRGTPKPLPDPWPPSMHS